jgi:predicted  nucleic acid-binding Zn-ribbon protein
MPHQCTGCGETFADGSKEMLSGCPECGGNKFQFRPAGAEFPDDPDPPEPETGEEPTAEESSVAETVGRATTRVRDFVSSDAEEPDPNATWPSESDTEAASAGSGGDGDIIDADARREEYDGEEDAAQASARSGLASSEEVREVGASDESPATREPTADGPSEPNATAGTDGPPTDGDERIVSEPTDEDPDLAELREQLNDQFESIKIVEPGQYELNLMELYDREEYIIALQENGRYVIQVPEQWIGEDVDDR